MIGTTVYVFEENHRVYAKSGQGGPIWREHWVPREVVGETTQSWLIGWKSNPTKVSKKDLREGTLKNICLSLEEVERKAWVHDNAYFLGSLVGVQDNYELLKKIAEMVNYKDRQP